MRGTINGRDARAATRFLWQTRHVPGYMAGEVKPILSLLPRTQDLVLIDVGANKGFWSKAFLNLMAGKINHIYMLDPSPVNFAELSRQSDNLLFDQSDFRLLSAHNFAAGSSVRQGILYTDEDGSPLASLFDHRISGASGTLTMSDDAGGYRAVQLDKQIPVEITTIDAFVSANGVSHIDVLKIDTEGNEYDVLLGAERCLSSRAIDCVFFEFGMHQVESRNFFIDFYSLFKSLDYEVFSIVDGRVVPVGGYSYNYENFSGTFTFAARRREAPYAAPPGFSEETYLELNPDVQRAIISGLLPSGIAHWLLYGQFENRSVR